MIDDPTLELLGRALVTDFPTAPPPERVAALSAEVERRRQFTEGPALAPTASVVPLAPRRRHVWLGRVVAGAAVAAAFVGGLLLAEDLPRPVREVAHAMGLPVDSPALVDARDSVDDLGQALAAGDAQAVAAADAEMLRRVDELSDAEREEVVPVAHEVHLRAVAFLEESDAG